MAESTGIVERNESIVAETERLAKQSIYKIPASLITDMNERAYKPQMVSIGPYHYGTERLQEMEKHKGRARDHFLRRLGKIIDDLRQLLLPTVQDLKDAYNQLDDAKWQTGDAFLDLMITDGCFILELLRSSWTIGHDYPPNDLIFSEHGKINIVPILKRDLLILENQIPMLVLEILYSIEPTRRDRDTLYQCILNFLQRTSFDYRHKIIKSLHILDLQRRCVLLEVPRLKRSKTRKIRYKPIAGKIESDNIMRSATVLREAGITIKKSHINSLKDISFNQVICGWGGGVLHLPVVVVDDAFESLYLNMMMYERIHVGAGNEVTSYVFLMGCIIDSVEDVALLRKEGVIQSALGSDQAVTKLFHILSRDCTLDPGSSLHQVLVEVICFCEKVESHCLMKQWHQWRGYCYHNYCTYPWLALSVVAAIIIFASTIIQTVFTVLAYLKPRSSG